MQGKKYYQPKLFKQLELSSRVPENNFYRRLKESLDLRFLYKATEQYYGSCGQKSVDPVVFYKLCLIGYLENIISDRKLIEHSSMRLDILYFLEYDIDEELPWHSTISRTRQLFPEDVFEQVFNKVFAMCVEKGMVAGHTQAVDSAPVKANASMESLELKVPEEDLEDHIRKIYYLSNRDRKAKKDKAPEQQRQISASDRELKEIESRNKKWHKDQPKRPGSKSKNARYTSNKTHYSPTDPDARISVKPGKARKLNYTAQLVVDTAHHVITDISADYADKKDSQSLEQITYRVKKRLQKEGMLWHNLIADTGYSSGESYAFLERKGLRGFIPPHGTYKGCPDGFTYDKGGDYYLCRNNKKLLFKSTKPNVKGIKVNHYATVRKDCRDCAYATDCKGKSHEKRVTVTYYKPEYERAIERVESRQGQYMKKKRQSTVEPVFGTLTQFMGLRKVNTKGLRQANKVMLMSAVAYNIKKYLKFTAKLSTTVANQCQKTALYIISHLLLYINPFKTLKIIRLVN
jgi:transposase